MKKFVVSGRESDFSRPTAAALLSSAGHYEQRKLVVTTLVVQPPWGYLSAFTTMNSTDL
jgi:hypothetical protein